MSWDLASRIEPSAPGDLYFDYCLWPYDPVAPVRAGALRSSALLYQSFAYAGVSDKMLALCDRFKQAAGRFRTVWGIKWADERLSWEFYFYDYARLDRQMSTARLMAATGDLLRFDMGDADGAPYFMFSLEIDQTHLDGTPVEQIDLYVGNPGSDVSSGICYGHSRAGREMRNFYFFFEADRHRQEIEGKIASNGHIPLRDLRLEQVLWPEMDPRVIVVANKRFSDALYFSRINVDDLAHALDRLRFPVPLRDWLRVHRAQLAHHYFDVGYDYVPAPGGGITMTKGSYYGIL